MCGAGRNAREFGRVRPAALHPPTLGPVARAPRRSLDKSAFQQSLTRRAHLALRRRPQAPRTLREGSCRRWRRSSRCRRSPQPPTPMQWRYQLRLCCPAALPCCALSGGLPVRPRARRRVQPHPTGRAAPPCTTARLRSGVGQGGARLPRTCMKDVEFLCIDLCRRHPAPCAARMPALESYFIRCILHVVLRSAPLPMPPEHRSSASLVLRGL